MDNHFAFNEVVRQNSTMNTLSYTIEQDGITPSKSQCLQVSSFLFSLSICEVYLIEMLPH